MPKWRLFHGFYMLAFVQACANILLVALFRHSATLMPLLQRALPLYLSWMLLFVFQAYAYSWTYTQARHALPLMWGRAHFVCSGSLVVLGQLGWYILFYPAPHASYFPISTLPYSLSELSFALYFLLIGHTALQLIMLALIRNYKSNPTTLEVLDQDEPSL